MRTRRKGIWLLKQPRLGARMRQGTFYFTGQKARNHILRICEKTVTTCCQMGARLAFSGLIC